MVLFEALLTLKFKKKKKNYAYRMYIWAWESNQNYILCRLWDRPCVKTQIFRLCGHNLFFGISSRNFLVDLSFYPLLLVAVHYWLSTLFWITSLDSIKLCASNVINVTVVLYCNWSWIFVGIYSTVPFNNFFR